MSIKIEHIKIEQAGPDGLPRLEGMIERMGYHKDPAYFPRCIEEQAAGKRLVFIAVKGGEDAGYAMLNFQPGYPPFRRLAIPEIQDLNVVQIFRRQGVAAALIGHCEDLARERGMETMGIGVGLNRDYGPAQRLYVRLGYLPDGAGAVYDRQAVSPGELRPVDDELCLMMMKDL